MLDVQREISGHLMKLETDKDAETHGVMSIDCSPEKSKLVYEDLTARLRALSSNGARIGLAGSYRKDIEKVLIEWSRLQRRHEALWNETASLTGLPASERCMRPSELTLTRLRIEEAMTSAIKGALL